MKIWLPDCSPEGVIAKLREKISCLDQDSNLSLQLYAPKPIHKLRHTNFMIFTPPPPRHRWSYFLDPLLTSVTSHILQFYT